MQWLRAEGASVADASDLLHLGRIEELDPVRRPNRTASGPGVVQSTDRYTYSARKVPVSSCIHWLPDQGSNLGPAD